jgi:hypothetical protein
MKAILEQMSRGPKADCTTGQSAPKFCEGDIEVSDVGRLHKAPVLKSLTTTRFHLLIRQD